MNKGLLKAYLIQILCKPIFWISILLITLAASYHFLSQPEFLRDSVSALNALLRVDAYRKMIPLFAAFPFTAQFVREWKGKIFGYIISRSGVNRYIHTQICICSTVSFLVCFIGMLLFIGITSVMKPLYAGFYYPVPPYGFFLSDGYSFLYLIIIISIFSMSCSVWSMFGLLLSAAFPNQYVALSAPFICSYLVEYMTFNFDPMFNYTKIPLGVQILKSPSAALNYAYTVLINLAIIMILGIGYAYFIRKRVRNELH